MNKTKELIILISGIFSILIFISYLVYQTNISTKISVEKKRIEIDSTLLTRIEVLEKQDSLILNTLSNISNKIEDYQKKQNIVYNNQIRIKRKLDGIEDNLMSDEESNKKGSN